MSTNNTSDTAAGPILVALGANLPSRVGSPRETLEAAIEELERRGVKVLARSRWFRSEPVPASSQDWYINGVIEADCDLDAPGLLALLHETETLFGRERAERNAARVLDLDLIAWRDDIRREQGPPELPHPRMQDRAFVLLPLADIAPDWVHPASGHSLSTLIKSLPQDQIAEPMEGNGD